MKALCLAVFVGLCVASAFAEEFELQILEGGELSSGSILRRLQNGSEGIFEFVPEIPPVKETIPLEEIEEGLFNNEVDLGNVAGCTWTGGRFVMDGETAMAMDASMPLTRRGNNLRTSTARAPLPNGGVRQLVGFTTNNWWGPINNQPTMQVTCTTTSIIYNCFQDYRNYIFYGTYYVHEGRRLFGWNSGGNGALKEYEFAVKLMCSKAENGV
mmetsp:Transcript_1254/g.3241  ORF Transcript_1254/g.3241 Transcript_1254/m.3241 type:complete len:213 (+) Transcript_1254:131-769(+)